MNHIPDFSFGGPVLFRGNDASSKEQEFEAEIKIIRKELGAAKAAGRRAFAAGALAEREHHVCNMADDGRWENAVELQRQNEELKKEKKTLQELNSKLIGELKKKEADIAAQEAKITDLTTSYELTKASLSEAKKKLDEEEKATNDINAHLENAYADLAREQSAHKATRKDKDDAEARLKETQLEFHDFHAQWESSEARIKELESEAAQVQELERESQALQDDIDNLRDQLGSHDRTILVKDARIQHLELQLQKALEGKLSAEAAASAAAEPTAVEPTFTPGDDSLEAELAAASDYADDESEFMQLGFSGITHIVDIPPVESVIAQTTESTTQTEETKRDERATATQTDAPKLTAAVIHSASIEIAPVEPAKEERSIAIQTDTPKLTAGLIYSASVDTVPIEPKLMFAPVVTQIDIAPVEATKPNFSSSETQTDDLSLTKGDATNLSTQDIAIQTDAIAQETTDRNDPVTVPAEGSTLTSWLSYLFALFVTRIVAGIVLGGGILTSWLSDILTLLLTRMLTVTLPSNKSILTSWRSYMLALLPILMVILYMQLEASKRESGYYYSRYGASRGAFGNGRYLFGYKPVGFSIGHSWLEETVCRHWASAIAVIEDRLGSTPTPLY